MRTRFFYVIFYLSTLFLVIACKPVSEFIEPVNYIETVKKIEINSPDYNSNKRKYNLGRRGKIGKWCINKSKL